MVIASVLILANVPKRYDYDVPPTLAVALGDMVNVVFAKRPQVGLVMAITSNTSSDFELLPILSVDTKRLPVPDDLRALLNWFRDFYCVRDYVAFKALIGLKKRRELPEHPPATVDPLPALSAEQSVIVDVITHPHHKQHLLHGITGSGKTHVYAHSIQRVIATGRSAIVLIPEISLTPQFTAFFSQHFDRIAIVHSGLTPKNKDIVWNRCLAGELDVIIGPRSAIFMPLPQIGLIIIDEEHDSSYKQDSHPRYYTHDVAQERARLHDATLVLGSATPSVDTYYKAQSGRMMYHTLTARHNNHALPTVDLLDMNACLTKSLVHPDLVAAIQRTLAAGQRTLLLVNRRGYASLLRCNACQKTQACPLCDTSYTYHADGVFRCHRCSSYRAMSRQCMHCGAHRVDYYGIAIQKIELEVRRLFPTARLSRLDRDTIKTIHDMTAAIESVDTADIVIGTQMIAKGHNFKQVALVGIIGGDTLLHFPDFRSSERLFQLITQMAGRAGRDLAQSRVLVQTFSPSHYVFAYAKHHNVTGFFEQELQYREPFDYPPYTQIINIIFSSTDAPKALAYYDTLRTFNATVTETLPNVQIIGPKVAPIDKAAGYYRHNVFYKIPMDDCDAFKALLRSLKSPRNLRLVVDISPQSLL
jgi:primosomal protein N' (replication factor Y)